MNTQCTKSLAFAGEVQGVNINKAYTIASVTKVFTSHWAVSKWGPKFRFPTVVYITRLDDAGTFDVHLEGGLYPYFDKTMYQFFVGQLNGLGVRKINFLTYDQNFLYSTNIRTNAPLAHGNDDLDVIEIMKDLRKDTTNINDSLSALNAKALALENLVLPAELSLSIGDIHYLDKAAFRPAPVTVAYYLYSTELYRNLKEMNRNSNNFVAEKIFKKLSENEEYLDFIVKRLGISADEINIQNGSGYPIYIANQKFYNQASCAAVVLMLDDLRQALRTDGLDCKDIMPVAGKDTAADGDSTVTQIYGNELTSGTLVGKTGSVLDTIALAGMIATENENVFFQTSFHVDESPDDRAIAYDKIRFWLSNELLKNKKKSDLDKYQPKAFMAFDGGSKLQRIIPLKHLY